MGITYSRIKDGQPSDELFENNGTNCEENSKAKKESDNCDQVPSHRLLYKRKNEKVRIVLLGKTGSGKSESGNTILNKNSFKSDISSESVTTQCTFGHAERFGKELEVIDTPGIFDTNMPKDILKNEIVKCIGMSAPGPHCFLLVIGCNARYTPDEKNTIYEILDLFGNDILKYTIIVFTRKDELDRHDKTFAEHIKNANESLQKTIQDCNHRCIAFNNIANKSTKEEQVLELLKEIDGMQIGNKEEYYTNAMYLEAEKALKARYKEIEDERKRKMEEEIQKIKSHVKENYTDINEQNMVEKKLTVQLYDRFSQLLHPRFQVMIELAKNGRASDILIASLGVMIVVATKHFARQGFRLV